MQHCKIASLLALTGIIVTPLIALDSSQVLFHAPFDGTLQARTATGQVEAENGFHPAYTDGIRGSAVRIGKSSWGETRELPVARMPVDVGLWRDYGKQESLGPLSYPATGNVNDSEGALSLWYKPLGWDLANSRDHFIANLGMKDSIAIAYLTYFGCFSFQNSVGEDTYKRCIAYLPADLHQPNPTRDTWTNVTMSWRDDCMKTWLNGKPQTTVKEEVVPLRNPTGDIRLGSGDYQEAAFDDVLILAQAIGDADAGALYHRNVGEEYSTRIAAPPIQPPTIDGCITSATEWRGASSLTGWADSLLGVANRDPASFSIGHDSEKLFVALRWPIPEKYKAERTRYVGSPLKISTHDRDGDIRQDDYAGVCLSPPQSEDVYFFGINGGGAVRDEKNGDASWNGNFQMSQAYDDKAWIVEFAIPLSSLAASANPDAEWGFNCVHGARQVDLLESVWCFQSAAAYPLARMELAQSRQTIDLHGMGNLGEGELAIKASICNADAQPFVGEAEVLVQEDGKSVFGPDKHPLEIAAGGETAISAVFSLSRPLYGEAFVRVRGAEGGSLLDYRLPFVFSRDLKLEANFVPTPSILQMVLDFGSTSTLKKVKAGSIAVTPQGATKPVLTHSLSDFGAVRKIIDLDCKALPVGKYDVTAALQIDSAATTLKDRFEKPTPPAWLGNHVGYSDKVPAPWVPLKATDRKVSCWERDYTLGAAGLPAQVRVLGQDILAAPTRAKLTVNGTELTLPLGSCKLLKATDSRVELRASTRAFGAQVDGDTAIEFDGFCWHTLKLTAPKDTVIDSFAIEFPLKSEFATLWWPAEYVPTGPGGETPKEAYTSNPINGMRIGDEEHGLQFAFETTSNWQVDAGKAQQLIPGAKEYVVRFNVIGRPTKLEKPLTLSIGIQALPARPRSPLFRMIDMDANVSGLEKVDKAYFDRTGKLFQIRAVYTEGWSRHWNYHNFWNEEVFEKDFVDKLREGVVARWEQNRNTLCAYLNVTTNDANTPEYRTYRHEWRPVPGTAPYAPPEPETRNKVVMASVCVNSKSYTDFYMYHLDKSVKYLSQDGRYPLHVYLDNSGQITCSNYLHGCPREGKTGVLAHREYMKRLYNIVKSVNPLNQVLIHCSGDNRMSSWGFSDVMIEGEQMSAHYMSRLANDPSLPKNYTKLITLAKARSQFQPLAYGPDRFYLYQFWGWNKSEPHEAGPARAHLWGLMMMHDSSVWAAGNAANIVKATEELGWDDKVEFIPYWRKNNGLQVRSEVQPVVASGWKRGNGNLLVMVLNDSDTATSCQLSIDFGKFGFKGKSLKVSDHGHGGLAYPDSLLPQEVKESNLQPGQTLGLEVGQHSYRLVRLHE